MALGSFEQMPLQSVVMLKSQEAKGVDTNSKIEKKIKSLKLDIKTVDAVFD